MTGRRTRPHTGRRRNEAARQAILDAAFTLVRQSGTDFTIDALATAAGVGRQTIYRWWPSKYAVLAESFTERAQSAAHPPRTGHLRTDLRQFLGDTFAAVSAPHNQILLRELMTAAQHDSHLAAVAADFTANRRATLHAILEEGRQRGELNETTNLNTLVDLAYGFLWYRLLAHHAPLDTLAADELTNALLAAGNENRPTT